MTFRAKCAVQDFVYWFSIQKDLVVHPYYDYCIVRLHLSLQIATRYDYTPFLIVGYLNGQPHPIGLYVSD